MDKIWKELHGLAERDIFGRSRACEGAPCEERKETYVAEATRRLMIWQKSRSNAGRRIYGKCRNYAAGKRIGVCSIAVCGQLPLPGRTMEGL